MLIDFLKSLTINNTVKFGSSYIGSTDIESRMISTVRMVMFGSQNAKEEFIWPFWRSGSCTLAKYKNHPLVITTRHELSIKRGSEPSEIDIKGIFFPSLQNELSVIPVKEILYDKKDVEDEYHDILMFKVDNNWDNYANEISNFPRLNRFHKSERFCSFAIGHLVKNMVLDYDTEKLKFVTSIFECKIDNEFQTQNRFYRRYTYNIKAVNLDGISGGAVYSLVHSRNGFEIVLDGIVIRASSGYLHIVDADFLFQLAEISIKLVKLNP